MRYLTEIKPPTSSRSEN